MPALTTNEEFINPPAGNYQYVAEIATGPIVFQVSKDQGSTWINMTDGSIAATTVAMIFISGKYSYRATIPGGDSLSLELVESGAA